MKNRMKLIPLVVALLLALGVISPAQDNQRLGNGLSQFVPGSPLIYAEARDLQGLLGHVIDNSFAGKLADSALYEDFTKSKLANKLADRISELEEVTGFGLTLERFRQLAGGPSAFALYDISDLQFVFISRINPLNVLGSHLWQVREQFESRSFEDGKYRYFVKEDPDGRVSFAFAVIDEVLVAGTAVNMFEQTINLLKTDGESLAGSEEFSEIFSEVSPLADFALYLDQKRVAETPQFRTYWIYDNRQDLSDIDRMGVSLRIEKGAITEERVLKRGEGTVLTTDAVRTAGYIPEGTQFNALAAVKPGSVENGFVWLLDTDSKSVEALAAVFDGVEPLEISYSSTISGDPEALDAGVNKALVLRLGNPDGLDSAAFENALAAVYAKRLLHGSRAGLRFNTTGNRRVLTLPLFENRAPGYLINGDILVLANRQGYLPANPGGTTGLAAFIGGKANLLTAYVLDSREMMENAGSFFKAIESSSAWSMRAYGAFFADNLVSLFSLLDPVSKISFMSWQDGDFTRERCVYTLGN